jgi:inward rectifier potassium channel
VLTRSWWEFVALVGGSFVLANAFFGFLYSLQPGSIANARSGSFEDAFFFSVQTMATIGYGGMAPATLYGHLLVTCEAIVAMLGVAVVTGVTFAKFAKPTARVLFADKIVLGPRDGIPHLMFRMANWRRNTILEAQLHVILLLEEISQEGHVMRRPMDLPLVRDRNSLFVMTWTAMHRIDESSPFYGPDALEKLRKRKAEIFLSVMGVDETFAQTVHARRGYKLSDIVMNAHFADVLSIDEDGTRLIDYRSFHEVVPVPERTPAQVS